MQKILVTGGTGYIGSHTVVELMNHGYTVLIADNLSNSDQKIVGQIEKITGKRPDFLDIDLADAAKMHAFAAQQQDIDGIIHFAAFKAVGESVDQPLKYYRNNLFSLINLIGAFPTTNLVFSSSCTVYGQPDSLPVNEEAQVKRAESPYGNTKQIAEEILAECAERMERLKVVALRYFNPVGSHESAMIGELPIGIPQNLVPFITQSAIGKRKEITVYGTDYDTPDGSAIRDYIHVSDVASAHVAALKFLARDNKASYNVFNIGTGTGYSVLEVIHSFERVTGQKLNYVLGQRREGDIGQIFGDVSLANEQLNWRAERDIDQMMRSAWAWELSLRDNPF